MILLKGYIALRIKPKCAKWLQNIVFCDLDGDWPETATDLVEDACLMEYIPKARKDDFSESEWGEKIFQHGNDMDDPADVQEQVLQWAKEQPFYGNLRFNCTLESPKPDQSNAAFWQFVR